MPASPWRVVITFTRDFAISRDLLRGVIDYGKQHPQLALELTHLPLEELQGFLNREKVSGVLSVVRDPALERAVRRSGIPAVRMLNAPPLEGDAATPRLPSVGTDDLAVGRVGAEHLMGLGLRRFAFCGHEKIWSVTRERGFIEALAKAGQACCATRETGGGPRLTFASVMEERVLRAWVSRLQPPVGVMAGNDPLALQLLHACEAAGMRVPEDVAIVGVDNDEMRCELAPVPLSSVSQSFERIGHEAARVLRGLIEGRPAKPRVLLLPPGPLVVRRSTDVFAFDDPNVSASMRLIRRHACEGLKVQDVLKEVPVSRTWLSQQFKRLVGRSPGEEIRRTRLARARELLAEGSLSVDEVAYRCGFEHVSQLSRGFRQAFGVSPREFRLAGRTARAAATGTEG